MRALAVFACLIACQPALAFDRIGGGFHQGGGHGFGHRGSGLVLNGTGFWGPFAPPVQVPQPIVIEAPAPSPVVIAAPFPLPLLPAAAPGAQAPQRSRGPHIIYIGHRPEIHGPKVIYGTE